jgi:hypothetical protein
LKYPSNEDSFSYIFNNYFQDRSLGEYIENSKGSLMEESQNEYTFDSNSSVISSFPNSNSKL